MRFNYRYFFLVFFSLINIFTTFVNLSSGKLMSEYSDVTQNGFIAVSNKTIDDVLTGINFTFCNLDNVTCTEGTNSFNVIDVNGAEMGKISIFNLLLNEENIINFQIGNDQCSGNNKFGLFSVNLENDTTDVTHNTLSSSHDANREIFHLDLDNAVVSTFNSTPNVSVKNSTGYFNLKVNDNDVMKYLSIKHGVILDSNRNVVGYRLYGNNTLSPSLKTTNIAQIKNTVFVERQSTEGTQTFFYDSYTLVSPMDGKHVFKIVDGIPEQTKKTINYNIQGTGAMHHLLGNITTINESKFHLNHQLNITMDGNSGYFELHQKNQSLMNSQEFVLNNKTFINVNQGVIDNIFGIFKSNIPSRMLDTTDNLQNYTNVTTNSSQVTLLTSGISSLNLTSGTNTINSTNSTNNGTLISIENRIALMPSTLFVDAMHGGIMHLVSTSWNNKFNSLVPILENKFIGSLHSFFLKNHTNSSIFSNGTFNASLFTDGNFPLNFSNIWNLNTTLDGKALNMTNELFYTDILPYEFMKELITTVDLMDILSFIPQNKNISQLQVVTSVTFSLNMLFFLFVPFGYPLIKKIIEGKKISDGRDSNATFLEKLKLFFCCKESKNAKYRQSKASDISPRKDKGNKKENGSKTNKEEKKEDTGQGLEESKNGSVEMDFSYSPKKNEVSDTFLNNFTKLNKTTNNNETINNSNTEFIINNNQETIHNDTLINETDDIRYKTLLDKWLNSTTFINISDVFAIMNAFAATLTLGSMVINQGQVQLYGKKAIAIPTYFALSYAYVIVNNLGDRLLPKKAMSTKKILNITLLASLAVLSVINFGLFVKNDEYLVNLFASSRHILEDIFLKTNM